MVKISKTVELDVMDLIALICERYSMTIEGSRVSMIIDDEGLKSIKVKGNEKKLVRPKPPENIIK